MSNSSATHQLLVRKFVLLKDSSPVLEPLIGELLSADNTIFTWPSALVLCCYLMTNRHIVENQTVLELGSGTGLVSIVASLLGARHTITTERAEHEFGAGYQLLYYNFALNNISEQLYTVVR